MSSSRAPLLALAVLVSACAYRPPRAVHDPKLPPPATESRAGTREPGAGPAPGPAAPVGRAPAASAPKPPPAAPPGAARRAQARSAPRDTAVRRAIAAAEGLVGRHDIVVSGVRYGDGCAALVRAAFAEAGAPLPSSATDAPALLALARARGAARRFRPAAGDLVFLSDRPGGPAEHVGLVASVAGDGTALVLHHTDRGVARLRLNAAQPWKARTDSGKALNDVLLVGAGRVTAGRLLVAWATLL